MAGKILNGQGFHCLPTIPGFKDLLKFKIEDTPYCLGQRQIWKIRSISIFPTCPRFLQRLRIYENSYFYHNGDIGQSFSSLSITINPLGSIILESQIKWYLYSTKTNIWRSPDNYVCNICDVRKTVKSPMAWDFPHIRKLAFTSCPLTIPWNLQCFHKKN